jgi:hypothetical protein
MPNPSGTFNDGGLVFGSQVVTIDSVAYVAESISVDRSTNVIEHKNEYGVPTGQVFVNQIQTGSMTLQLASSSTASPTIGDTVAITPVGGGSAKIFLISKVGEAFSQDGETKVTVDMRERLNTP